MADRRRPKNDSQADPTEPANHRSGPWPADQPGDAAAAYPCPFAQPRPFWTLHEAWATASALFLAESRRVVSIPTRTGRTRRRRCSAVFSSDNASYKYALSASAWDPEISPLSFPNRIKEARARRKGKSTRSRLRVQNTHTHTHTGVSILSVHAQQQGENTHIFGTRPAASSPRATPIRFPPANL